MTRALLTGTRHGVAALARQPLTVAALVVLLPVVIETYGTAVRSFPAVASGTTPATTGRLVGALFSVAFLAGVVGLFQVVSATRGDRRLVLAGYPRWALLVTRLATTVAVAAVGASVAVAVLAARVPVAAPAAALASLALAGLVYGLVGVVVGTLVPRELDGSVVLVFVADLDNVLSSGLFPLTATVPVPGGPAVRVTDLAPLSHPSRLLTAAVLDGTVPAEHLVPAAAWVGGLLVVAAAAHGHATGDGVGVGWSA